MKTIQIEPSTIRTILIFCNSAIEQGLDKTLNEEESKELSQGIQILKNALTSPQTVVE